MSSPIFVAPTMALASNFPELDPIALLQLVEAPIVCMAFHVFREQFWDEFTTNEPAEIDIDEISEAVAGFEEKPEGNRSIGLFGAGMIAGRSEDEHPITIFMCRLYAWASQESISLPIQVYLKDAGLRANILWGILGICISLHINGEFPAPPETSLPAEEESDDVEKKIRAFPVTYDPCWLPIWEEWRMRHEILKEQANDLVHAYAAQVADGFANRGKYSEVAQMQKWLDIPGCPRVYKSVYFYRFGVKHIIHYNEY
ncbi:hypothetical protein NUW58_g5875 [Xylaria curta]|uniref:Uncharacterized protein n=1 Tax=Xylaria curta TaxID=42375 RepID=A0ACC1P0R6_9PEZI|nr:hypothetical protein NUW58_g5875 [Xylaria curta]